jgi:hypothetical protein
MLYSGYWRLRVFNLGVSLNIQHQGSSIQHHPAKIDYLIATKNKELLDKSLQRLE